MSASMNELYNSIESFVSNGKDAIDEKSIVDGYLRFTRGEWFIDDEKIDDYSEWAVKVDSFKHGWINWKDNVVVDKILVPVNETPPEPNYKEDDLVMSVILEAITGQHEGVVAVYETSTFGGLKAMRNLLLKLLQERSERPRVMLGSEGYKHKKYGIIYNPVFSLLRDEEQN